MRSCLLALLVVLPSMLLAQKEQKAFNVHSGISKRFHPLTLEDKYYTINRRGMYFSSLKQFVNYDFSLDVSKRIIKQKFHLQLSNYFRYDHNHYERISVEPDIHREVKKFKRDHFLDLMYEWKKKRWKDFSLWAGGGYGVMNANSDYRFNQVIARDSTGTLHSMPVSGGFEFWAPRIMIGAQKGNFRALVMLHGTPDENYETYLTIWPEVKLTYRFLH